MNSVKVAYQFDGILEPLQESIKKYVDLNLYVNPEARNPLLKPYFKKIFTNKPEAEVSVNIHIAKNKLDRFDGVFTFMVDGHPIRYERQGSDSFRSPSDLVNHAFAHFKLEVIGERGVLRKIA
jgi:hypothetical protein